MSTGQPPRESFQRISDSAKPCRLWQKGHCKFGDKCRFLHAATRGTVPSTVNTNTGREIPNKSKNVQPKRADTGKRTQVHPETVEDSPAANISTLGTAPGPSELTNVGPTSPGPGVRTTICIDWKNGKCHRGEHCQYRHDARVLPVNTKAAQKPAQPHLVGGKNRANRGMGAADEGPAPEDTTTEKTEEATVAPLWRVRREGSRLFLERTDVHEEERGKAEEEKQAREEAGKRVREDEAAQRLAEAERRAREEAKLRVQEETRRRAREEAEMRAREEAERIAREEAERKAREAAERKAREAAERQAREEAERRARAEAEMRAREEVERRAREAAERRAREEAERKAREAAERRAREAAERVAREEAERKAREKAEREAREEAERKAREAAERRAREEAERRAREKAERKAMEAAQRKAKAEKKAREEAERREKELEERRAREAAERRAREEAARRRLEERRTMEAAVVEQYVVLDSSLVTCAAGLEINNVVTGFDLCRITVKNLPRNARRHEIVQIFTGQGVDTSEFFVSSVKEYGNHQEAIVLANAEHGEAIALGLEGIPFREETLTFEVSENASWNSMGTSKRNANVLTVTWHGPAETIIATYDSEQEARAKIGQLNMRFCKGRKIRAMMNTGWQATSCSIKLLGFPQGTTIDFEVDAFTGTTNLRLLRSPTYTVESSLYDIRQRLQYTAKVERHTYHELVRDPKNGPLKVQVAFETWEAAKVAFDAINTRPTPGCPVYRPFLPKPVEYTIKIPRQQYEAQKKQWEALSEKKEGPNAAYVNVRRGDRGDFFVHVEGEDKKAAGALKVRVESMVAGDKLDASYWHPSWVSRNGVNFFDRVRQNTKVHVWSDFKTRSLKIYGEPSCLNDARKMIKDEVDRLAGLESTVTLERRMVGFFIRKGLGVLKELVGEDNVSMNIAACRITIKGGQEANHHLTRLIDESRAAWSTTAIGIDDDNTTCPICYDDASNPEVLGCGHTYCSGCLRHYLHSALEGGGFPLVCLGDETKCKVPMAIPLIQRFMPQQAFQDLVEAAFRVYLDTHPQEFKYCTTPDCKQIYRHGTDKKVLQCPSCFSSICPACDEEAHEGMTCQERKVHKDPALQDRLFDEWAAANGVHKCPGCRASIQKSEGCNHMTCLQCNTHFCWRCDQVFDEHEIYNHMQRAHGNFYDEAPAGVNLGAGGVAGQVDELNRLQQLRAVGAEAYMLRLGNRVVGGVDDDELERMRRRQAGAAGRAPPLPPRRNLVENDLVRQEEQRRLRVAEVHRQEIEQQRILLRHHELRQQQRLREAEATRQAEEARRLAEERRRRAVAEEYRRQGRVVQERREQQQREQQRAQAAKEEGSWCTVM